MNSKTRLFIAVFVPVVIMLLWIIRLSLISSNPVVRLRIEGFDPRDLLSGHYLIYNVNYGTAPDCSENDQKCLCLDNSDHGFAVIQDQAPSCDYFDGCRYKLLGRCENGRFNAGIERFYFAETSKRELTVVPPNSSIEVALDHKGRGIVRDLFVEDMPVREWLKSVKEANP